MAWRTDIPRALAVMQLAHRKKLLDDDANVRKLASLLQSEDIPIRSVHVLEQGFEQKVLKEEATSYEMLGNSWILARESDKAEPALEKAAELSPEGDLYVRLGQVRLLKEDCDGAIAALKSGLAKGGVDDPGAGRATARDHLLQRREARRGEDLVREVAPVREGPPDRRKPGSSTSTKSSRSRAASAAASGSVGL